MSDIFRPEKPFIAILRLLIILALFLGPLSGWQPARPATAAPLDLTPARLDTGFDPGGGANNTIFDIKLDPDGFLFVAGTFTQVDGFSRNGVARLNADGSLDNIYFSPSSGADAAVLAVAVQPDGKVIVGGSFTHFAGEARSYITRLQRLGDLDTSFQAGATVSLDGTVCDIAVLPDGKIIIVGSFTHVGGVSRNRIARLNTDGTLDTSFDPGQGADATTETVVVQSDGKLLIGGYFTSIDSVSANFIARLNADGSRDTTFLGSTNSVVRTIALQTDGKIVIGGDFTNTGGTDHDRIARLEANGKLDTSFDPGSGADASVYAVAVQADGKVLVGGDFTTFNGNSRDYLIRLNDDGSLDSTHRYMFYTGANNSVQAMALQPDGKVVLAGSFTDIINSGYARVARLHTDGTLDDGFDTGSGTGDVILGLATQPDGKTVFWGDFTSFSGYGRNRIARLHLDGSMDVLFNTSAGPNGIVQDAALLEDGKIVIGGNFTSVSTTARNGVARLNTNGSLDTSFVPGSGANGSVYALAVQSDGKVLVGGDFTAIDGIVRTRIARLNADGSLDTGFYTANGANDSVRALVIQSDGKILVGGDFTTIGGLTRNRIARLNTDGSPDASFDPGSGADHTIYAIALQSDGKILVGGGFTTMDGTASSCIARLETDGSLDSSFATGAGFNLPVYRILVREDGHILVGGIFTTYQSIYRPRLARLLPNGNLDSTFDTGASGGPNWSVFGLAFQPGGKVVIGGEFTTYDGTAAAGLARLNGTSPIGIDANFPDGEVGASYNHDCNVGGFPTPIFWWVTSGNLPPGLSLDSETGQITGTPTAAGSDTFDIRGCNYTTLCTSVTSAMITITPATEIKIYLPSVLR